MNNVTLFEAARLLLTNDDYLILIHEHADGDAVGSAEALRLGLTALGKRAKVYAPDGAIPGYLSELPVAPFADTFEGARALITVDVAEERLLGAAGTSLAGKILLKLDHHRTGSDFARYNYTDPTAAAAGEIIYDLLDMTEAAGREALEMIYVAVASDTGGFRYSNTTAKTLAIAARLYEAGIDAEKLNRILFENKDLKTVRATALGVEKTEFFLDGRAALCCFTNEMRAVGGYADEHLAELSSALREIGTVEVAAVLKQEEGEQGKYRLSTRSKRFFDCAALCAAFEGGGHLRAAGGTVYAGSPEEASRAVRDEILKLWKN